ncbi:MAG: acetate--CoA ligase family protein [Candidatus Micrarchaeota archaeon]
MTRTMDVVESLKLLSKYKIQVAHAHLAKNEKELLRFVKKTGFPLVLKVVSKKAVHKTEHKGVYTNIKSEKEAQNAFKKLQKISGFEGALVQQQIYGSEWLIGSKTDTQFGATIVFGIGGIWVELLKDVTLRVLPVTKKDCEQMIREIKHQQLVNGFRGQPPLPQKKAVQTLMQIGKLIQKEKPLEMDINPLIATEKGLIAVDCRFVFE